MLFGAIEAGGTKFVLGIGRDTGEIIDKKIIDTKGPEETIGNVIDYFKDKDIKALGIGCFGPLDLNKISNSYGYITSTPKKEWINFDILGNLKKHLEIPMEISTDVSAAALGETRFGNYRDSHTVLYITVGTGIGGGYVIDKKIHNGMLHPELGHIIVRRNKNDDYIGKCYYHKDCFEGLASGPAIEERAKIRGRDIPEDHISWTFVGDYIAQALMNYILVLSPTTIVLGGGVMDRKYLYPIIRERVKEYLNGYVVTDEIKNIGNYIVEPSLGNNSGIIGALALAIDALKDSSLKLRMP